MAFAGWRVGIVFMGAIKTQFFVSYAILGSLMPLLGVFLKDVKGLSAEQVGLASGLTSLAMLTSPVLITLLADTKLDSRRILAVAFAMSATVLAAMGAAQTPFATIVLFMLHGFAFVAMLPLMDGFFFSYAEEIGRGIRLKEGEKVGSSGGVMAPTYPRVRVWGTIGFILPSLILWWAIRQGADSSVIVPCAIFFCVLSLLNSFRLPKVEWPVAAKGAAKLPTREALSVLFSAQARVLCIGLFLAYLSTAAFYAFIAIFLSDVVGVKHELIGLVMAIGVFLEIFWTLYMPKLQSAIRLKGILVSGLALMGVRMIVLAKFPYLPVVIIAMVSHGLEVLALFIVPVMYLNRLAGDRFRNSMQGVFTMSVSATSRILGAFTAGWLVAHTSLETMFVWAGVMGLVAAAVVLIFFRNIPEDNEVAGDE